MVARLTRAALAGCAALGAAALGGCTTEKIAPPSRATPEPITRRAPAVTAEIKLFEFVPGTLTVTAGATVVWTNTDGIIHSVTNGTSPTPAGAFDSDFFDQGQTFAFTFTQPGSYPYFCKRHPFMQGVVNVSAP